MRRKCAVPGGGVPAPDVGASMGALGAPTFAFNPPEFPAFAPLTSPAFALGEASTPQFTQANGVLTYSGPPARFQVVAAVSGTQVGVAGVAVLAILKNGATVPTSPFAFSSASLFIPNNLSVSDWVTLQPGDTLAIGLSSSNVAETLNVASAVLSVGR